MIAGAGAVFADSFNVSYLDAGIQAPQGIANHYEFNDVLFSQMGGSGFESDNHPGGVLSANPSGTPVEATPEPTTLVYLLFGVGVVGGAHLRRALTK